MADAKPKVLILGGTGFVGRHLTTFLVSNGLCSLVRVVDKVPPATAWLNAEHQAVFQQVDFKQANLAVPQSAERAFSTEDGPFDYVFNLAAETKYGQSTDVYKERVLDVAVNCGREACRTGVKRFVHMSTAQVYDCDKIVSHEGSRLQPWTTLAQFHLKAEQELEKIDGLPYLVLRPAVIYGVGDLQGLTPRLIVGAVYRELGEKMKLLWTKSLHINTVHVRDVVMALWHLRDNGEVGQVYNIVDKGNTTQGTISTLVSSLFKIEHDYFGTMMSNLAKLHMSGATEESNEKHLGPWSAACHRDNISNTPLSPYMDQELLYNRFYSQHYIIIMSYF
jgi:nucleoside-diphosphate-sugar epimerase